MARDPYIQALRGVAISAVVLIHCLPQSSLSVAVRPLLNFAVALFVFLSGCLTTPEKCGDVLGFYRRRIGKVLAPYLVWSLLYLLARSVTDPVAIGRAILVGGGSAQMYYLLVYMQLVLVTPLLYRILDKGETARLLLYAVTPALLVLRYALGAVSMLLDTASCHFGRSPVNGFGRVPSTYLRLSCWAL